MKYEIERLKKSQVKFTFEVDANEWEAKVDKVYRETKNKYNVQGFRKGHATRKIIEMTYGANVFFDEAFNNCVNEVYVKALDEHEDIIPVEQPHIEIEKFDNNGLIFSTLVSIKPEVKLGAYTGLEIPKTEYTVTDEEVDSELEIAREKLSRQIEITDREVQNGDIVNLNYCGKIDGVAFQGGTAKNQMLTIGSGQFIPGFEEQMIGMKIGETKDLNVKFPDDYGVENISGKDAVFTVTVLKIFVKELPELNDKFASDTSKFETLAEYKADIKKNITERKASNAKYNDENKLLDAVVKNAEVEIPDCMIESQLDYIIDDFKYRISYMYPNMKIDDYFKITNSNLQNFREQRRPEAENSVKTRLVVEQLIKDNDIEVTDEDLDNKIKSLAERDNKTAEEFKKTLVDSQYVYIRQEALMDKTIAFLETKNKYVKETKATTTKKATDAEKEKPAETAEKPKKATAKKTASAKETAETTEKPKKTTAKKGENK